MPKTFLYNLDSLKFFKIAFLIILFLSYFCILGFSGELNKKSLYYNFDSSVTVIGDSFAHVQIEDNAYSPRTSNSFFSTKDRNYSSNSSNASKKFLIGFSNIFGAMDFELTRVIIRRGDFENQSLSKKGSFNVIGFSANVGFYILPTIRMVGEYSNFRLSRSNVETISGENDLTLIADDNLDYDLSVNSFLGLADYVHVTNFFIGLGLGQSIVSIKTPDISNPNLANTEGRVFDSSTSITVGAMTGVFRFGYIGKFSDLFQVDFGFKYQSADFKSPNYFIAEGTPIFEVIETIQDRFSYTGSSIYTNINLVF